MKNMNHQQKRKQYVSLKSTPALTYCYWNFLHNLWHTCNKFLSPQHVKFFNLVLAFNLLEKLFIYISMYAPEAIDIIF